MYPIRCILRLVVANNPTRGIGLVDVNLYYDSTKWVYLDTYSIYEDYQLESESKRNDSGRSIGSTSNSLQSAEKLKYDLYDMYIIFRSQGSL